MHCELRRGLLRYRSSSLQTFSAAPPSAVLFTISVQDSATVTQKERKWTAGISGKAVIRCDQSLWVLIRPRHALVRNPFCLLLKDFTAEAVDCDKDP